MFQSLRTQLFLRACLLIGGIVLLALSWMAFFVEEDPVTLESLSVYGAVVPHHTILHREISDFWQQLDERVDPDLIILIGPDHENRGETTFSLTYPEQEGEVGQSVVESLLASQNVDDNQELIRSDHSVDVHFEFLPEHHSDAIVVPMVVQSAVPLSELFDFIRNLDDALPSDGTVAVVASVDFSHYETRARADELDRESFKAIQAFDYDLMTTFGPEYMDSEEAIIIASEMACPTRDCVWEEWFYGNSADFPGTDPLVTTSYFSLFLGDS